MRAPTRPILPFWVAVAVAIGAGPVLDWAFPDLGIWPMIFPGVVLSLVPLVGRRLWSAYLMGFLTGLSFFLELIPWISKFLGDGFAPPISSVPWVALSMFEAFFWGAGAVLFTLAYRWVPRAFPGLLGRLVVLPVVIAGLWTLREAVTSTWPWGGFSWGRLAFSQSQSPFATLLPWLGVAGVTFLIAFIAASAIEAVRIGTRATWTKAAIVVVAITTVLLLVPKWQPNLTGATMRVAAVQGNGKAGYFGGAKQGDLLRAQFDATEAIPDKTGIDVVVWPEGGSDVDPLEDPAAAQAFDYISSQFNAPFVSGAITERDGVTYNSSLLWEVGHNRVPVDIYDKRHPVPFGEYVPARSFFEPLAPDLISLIGRDYTPGTTDAVFNINGVIAGINICFDIVDDALMTESVDAGAQIILAQSNNADFGTTDESVQQLEIARVRAIELGRSVVVNSTVGTSAVIRPDGSTQTQLTPFTAAAMVEDVPLASGTTPAVALGVQVEWFVALLALATLIGSAIIGRGGKEKRR